MNSTRNANINASNIARTLHFRIRLSFIRLTRLVPSVTGPIQQDERSDPGVSSCSPAEFRERLEDHEYRARNTKRRHLQYHTWQTAAPTLKALDDAKRRRRTTLPSR